jgi:hypothetical protein
MVPPKARITTCTRGRLSVGGLFGGGSPPAPDTSKQRVVEEKQEARTKRQEAEEQRRLAAQIAARRSRGARQLRVSRACGRPRRALYGGEVERRGVGRGI